jgi:signal peptidase II
LKKAIFITLIILLIDQSLKIWVKTHMTIGQEIHVLGNWFILHFTENEGMAFGFKFGGASGKLILSLFRIIAVIGIAYYIHRIGKKNASPGLIFSFSLIMAGALGNILDSAFYGMIFSQSTYHEVATLFPAGGGYNSFLHGKVVDMLYFPIVNTTLPQWIPFWGGDHVIFFRPVFNIADSSITIGVLSLILFQRSFFGKNTSIPEAEIPKNS